LRTVVLNETLEGVTACELSRDLLRGMLPTPREVQRVRAADVSRSRFLAAVAVDEEWAVRQL
jgi:hypothetical protein